MTSYSSLACCPCCKVDTCLSGDTIDTGCCLGCDDLIMWSERPGFSISQRHFLKSQPTCYPGNISFCENSEAIIALGAKYNCIPTNCDDVCNPSCFELSPCPAAGCDDNQDGNLDKIGKIMNYTVYAEELEPLQTVYRFYKTYWRPIGFYSGSYPVHGRTSETAGASISNTHRRALASQLPVAPDPIHDGEFLSPLLSRCKYETVEDWPKMYWWQPTYLRTVMQSCLNQESPCAESLCNGQGDVCDPNESPFCGSFILDHEDIIQDLKRGYKGISEQEFSAVNCCYPICDDPPCTQVTHPPLCECESYWLTPYRRRKLLDNYRHTWGVDIECYNDPSLGSNRNAFTMEDEGDRNYKQGFDINIGPEIIGAYTNQYSYPSNVSFRLADHWLFNVSHERWWKIGKDMDGEGTDGTGSGLSQSFWNIPKQSGTNPNPTANNAPYPYQVDDLVPKWWIYACSSVPFFQFEMEDAFFPMNSASSTPRQALNQELYDEFILYRQTNLLYAEYSLQSLWNSLAEKGYFEAKDWREEQYNIYVELNQRFPNKGYEVYVAKYSGTKTDGSPKWMDMPLLGPYRKRYYAPHNVAQLYGMKKPYLRPDLVPKSALTLQAECFLEYPGQFPTKLMDDEERQQRIDDYYYWAERQWVYFRGVPAGWVWASWDAELTCPCNQLCEGGQAAPNEDAAILAGCGRAKGNCIESWFNQPQEVITVNNPDNYTCRAWGQGGSQECNACFGDCLTNCNQPSGCEEICNEQCADFCFPKNVKVPQCLVPTGTSSDTSGAPYQCEEETCLNCCKQCQIAKIAEAYININSVVQLNNFEEGSPVKFRFTFTAGVTPSGGGGVPGGESTEYIVVDERYIPRLSSTIKVTGYTTSNTLPVELLAQLLKEPLTITSSNYGGIFEAQFTPDSFNDFVNQDDELYQITLQSNQNIYTATITETTGYYCDDSDYFDETSGQEVSCEEFKCPDQVGFLDPGQDPFCGCAATPLIGCADGVCQKVSVTGYCGGVHIIVAQYAAQNKLDWGCPTCGSCSPKEPINSYYRCLWTANTFLTPARNLYEFEQNNKKCTSGTNTSMFSYWPTVKNSHMVPQKHICNSHYATTISNCTSANDAQYKTVPACESGICWPWWRETRCCGVTCTEEQALENPNCECVRYEGEEYGKIGCLQRMVCVSLIHGKQWDGRNVCPPSCGTDDPSYSNYSQGSYYGRDGDSGGPTESSCERNDFIGYEPICGKRSVEEPY